MKLLIVRGLPGSGKEAVSSIIRARINAKDVFDTTPRIRNLSNAEDLGFLLNNRVLGIASGKKVTIVTDIPCTSEKDYNRELEIFSEFATATNAELVVDCLVVCDIDTIINKPRLRARKQFDKRDLVKMQKIVHKSYCGKIRKVKCKHVKVMSGNILSDIKEKVLTLLSDNKD